MDGLTICSGRLHIQHADTPTHTHTTPYLTTHTNISATREVAKSTYIDLRGTYIHSKITMASNAVPYYTVTPMVPTLK